MPSHSFTPNPRDQMSTDANGRRQGGGGSLGEDPIEVGRYLEALRRSRWLIVTIVVVITAAVLAFSVTLPKTYEATASIVVDNASGLVSSNETQTVQRNLATTATLATTAAVLRIGGARRHAERHRSQDSGADRQVASGLFSHRNQGHVDPSFEAAPIPPGSMPDHCRFLCRCHDPLGVITLILCAISVRRARGRAPHDVAPRGQ